MGDTSKIAVEVALRRCMLTLTADHSSDTGNIDAVLVLLEAAVLAADQGKGMRLSG